MTDGEDWTLPLGLDGEMLWQPGRQPNGTAPRLKEIRWRQPGAQPNGAAPRQQFKPPGVSNPAPPPRQQAGRAGKLYRRGNVTLSVIMGLLVAGGIANAIYAGKNPPSKPAAAVSRKAPVAHSAAQVTAGISAAQEQFVSVIKSSGRWHIGSGVSAAQIADFGQSVCSSRRGGKSQLTVITAARGRWANSSAMSADAMVRLAEKDICPAYLPPETVTYVVRGTPGTALVTYGPAGFSFNGSVPLRVIRPLHNPKYYWIDAQVQGAGTVTCVIKIDGIRVAAATASGDSSVASCRIGKAPKTRLWENENNG